MLAGKRVLLGVSGSIAAYKIASLVRLLIKAGAEVQVVMTQAATEFITPLTLSTLSKRPVYSQFVSNPETGTWTNHVDLGLWADVMLIAPATAHTLAKAAHAQADDLLSAVYLSARCPVYWAPAMDLDMYQHPATKENLRRLESFGNRMIQAGYGELASGLTGEGRMAEPEELLSILEKHFQQDSPWKGKKVLLTAGPTQEAIDPVRYISNHSTGKMGYALAEALAEAGALVTLVSGPTHLLIKNPTIRKIDVRSAGQMYEAAQRAFPEQDVTILAAAVADYTPSVVASEKIKKKEAIFNIELRKTVDIAATLGSQKKPGQLLIGFALETNNEVENATQKLLKKNLDLIVLNSLQNAGAGFGHDTNQISIIDRQQRLLSYELKSKTAVATDILEAIAAYL
ncbi:bifunctional phosphopantothenoylcysteine decarboxylase/phosphopantothenate--cysteine ligase CoaBC [Siphonobacter sp. SORGH_AS_0500]|uniref:bifunctional phosphopantothenoylcysteine decarboxylase/phosphopantothenate--cysteine ligase CoaBC n=1 Tax=Siphonobacter sp. SORGH_AS_0500 TaxID=1864824 RepID=UPI00285CB0CA|nr:bifunctional phosphopantothenoylcysteine decarboxylase/phosphopantothenate--cysteine ligase CoaBC [Siphonobacter sp. SORGH_AS_0500]MDR6197072.1 phosphopantothenoylcysteine decarboxylase/phosphopantothenate--cysteine ligase [Siphonobacter sp. SORGH_AS_0500]